MLLIWSVVSDSLLSHELQYAQLSCPSLSPRVCSDSCPLSWWCHPTILSSVTLFSSWPQSFPVSGSFLMSWLFASGGQSIRASASVLPMNIRDWFPLELTSLISSQLRDSQEASPIPQFKSISIFFMVQLSHLYMTTGKTIALTIQTFFGKVISLIFNTLSKFVIAFLPRSKHLLISWLQSLSAVILEPNKVTVSTFSSSWNDETGCHDLSFLNIEF